MKLIAAAILVGALVIALAVVLSRPDVPASDPAAGPVKLRCELEGGFWVDGGCVMPPS
jgi:hypothetical protein